MITCAVTECLDTPFLHHPINLCCNHALMVSLNVTDILHANALGQHVTSNDVTEKASVAPDVIWEQNSHPAVVYFLTNGDRVKIGTSTNITARVTALALRKGNAALLLQGGYDLEDALHKRFEVDRIGRTEWFVLSDRIRGYIAQHKAADATLKQPPIPTDVAPEPAQAPARYKKPDTAEDKILSVLITQGAYIHRHDIGALAKLEIATLENTLSKLTKSGKIHRQVTDGKEVRGMYGPGPAPAAEAAGE
ncbi:GIY-YIG nuclease family protein [Streptomyces chartreusis]|uniref:GIY-YIG nuclease family protein n=1 Tax=Streptomyces chartreusis TaxID=1969 RepID=UPI00371B9183